MLTISKVPERAYKCGSCAMTVRRGSGDHACPNCSAPMTALPVAPVETKVPDTLENKLAALGL